MRVNIAVALLVVVAIAVAGVAVIDELGGGTGGTGGAAHARDLRAARAPVVARRVKRARSSEVRNAHPQAGWKQYTGSVPILVYHELGTPPAGAPFPGLYVSDADFSAEMAWLHNHGYQAVTLDEMMHAWYHGGTLPRKPIVITFDNGYLPQITEAPHVMSHYGWPGVLNEITENHLHPAQIRSILKIGWEVDSHSLTHPDLTTLDASELQQQVADSRTFLRRTFHIPANSFCYPSSRYNAAVIAAVKAAGYTNAVTENAGYANSTEPFTLPRFEIESGVSQLSEDLLSYQPAGYGK
jgi:peptidoglycan/xylan/chitin deacetylase (PgdA/CDA1 family)